MDRDEAAQGNDVSSSIAYRYEKLDERAVQMLRSPSHQHDLSNIDYVGLTFDSDLGCEAWYQWSRTSFTQRPLERRIPTHRQIHQDPSLSSVEREWK